VLNLRVVLREGKAVRLKKYVLVGCLKSEFYVSLETDFGANTKTEG
jgi:hypothetical protein